MSAFMNPFLFLLLAGRCWKVEGSVTLSDIARYFELGEIIKAAARASKEDEGCYFSKKTCRDGVI